MFEIKFAGNSATEIFIQMTQFLQFAQPAAPAIPAAPPAIPVQVPPATQMTPAPAQAAPTAPAQPTAAPMTQPPAAVPTAIPDYSAEQIGRAVAAWIDKAPDNRKQALDALNALGYQSITQLDTPSKRGAYVNALRSLGVQI